MSDQLVAVASTWQHTTLNNRQTDMPPVGFEPTISARELPQNYALDHAVTEFGQFSDLTVRKKEPPKYIYKDCL